MPSTRLSQALAFPSFNYSLAVSVSGANAVLGPTLRSAEQPLLYLIARVNASACKPTAAVGGPRAGAATPVAATVANLVVRIQNIIAAVVASGDGDDSDRDSAALLPRVVGMRAAGASGVVFEYTSLVEAARMYCFLTNDYSRLPAVATMVKETLTDFFYIEPAFTPPAPAVAGAGDDASPGSSIDSATASATEGDDDAFIVQRSRFKTNMFKRNSSFGSTDSGSMSGIGRDGSEGGGGYSALADNWEDAEEQAAAECSDAAAGPAAAVAAAAAMTQRGNFWGCDRCTFKNGQAAGLCEMCGNVNDWIDV